MTTFRFMLFASTWMMANASGAFAQTIDHLPIQGSVTVRGMVEKVLDPRHFTLRDETGVATVEVQSNQSLILKQGASVTVNGTSDGTASHITLRATDVSENKSAVQGLADAVSAVPGLPLTDAASYTIAQLPSKGDAKVTGTVTQVFSAKEFHMTDKTGGINVDVPPEQSALIRKGARVTVIGNVGHDAVGKDINATRIIVIADAREK